MQKKVPEPVHSLKFLRQRKFLLFLPVLIVPFLTLLFWALGGGKVRYAGAADKTTAQVLNLQLPEAHLKEEKGLTKLSFYEQSEKDSMKLGTQALNDPLPVYGLQDGSIHNASAVRQDTYAYDPTPPIGTTISDPNEEKIYQKLQELNKVMNQSSSPKHNYSVISSNNQYPLLSHPPEQSGLEETFSQLDSRRNDTSDVELLQLNQMMDKIIAIQHPKQVKRSEEKTVPTNEPIVVPVLFHPDACTISLLGDTTIQNDTTPITVTKTISFYSLNDPKQEIPDENAIPAIIRQTQTLVSGSVVKLRLLQSILIQGQIIPKGTFVYGITSLKDERLNVQVSTIHFGNAIYPIHLEVYDLDGLSGIYVPGTLTKDIAKQSTDNALQSIELTTIDRSLASQATSAGIQAAKSLLSKKTKQIRVTLKAGYQVFLKSNASY